ncbi:MAG: tRNA lysidine(34) synthetase TilS [Rubrivivax sp.]|nr:tRNA lysidine(34) synthetase TilS [Rubrivivax sp.]
MAASGGRDSTALLHATVRCGRALGIEVVALHVHHGLQAAADAWQAQVKAQSGRWGARFETCRLEGAPKRGESVEAWARRGRYRALAAMARAGGCGLVLLAHHRRDQAETFLLQALRGGGPRGLSAMPATALRDGILWARPWLDRPREAIDAYVRRHRLAVAEDPSNGDPRFARNALRAAVWPALSGAFPEAEAAFATAATRAQQAAGLAMEVAAADLAEVAERGELVLAPWMALSPARRRNALEAWLRELPEPVPGTLLERLCVELPGVHQGRWPAGGFELRLYRGRLSAAPTGEPAVASKATVELALASAGVHEVPTLDGCFVVETAHSGGARVECLRRVLAGGRQGGEQFRLSPRGTARSLKKQFQARGVPAWEREGPLLYTADGQLLFVPGLGIDGALQATPGAPQLTLRWVPGPRQPAK